MKIIYSFNKTGKEADTWTRELSSASTPRIQLIPFNHQRYVDPYRYLRAQLLDNLYYDRDPDLLRLYRDIEQHLHSHKADVLLVDNLFPYHPEFLRSLSVYKILRGSDGPVAAYDRDFAYLHAYDHVLYHSPAYSKDMTMPQKLAYCGARRFDFWPQWLFDSQYDPSRTEKDLNLERRPVDVVFVGGFHVGKMADLARIKRHFGRRCRMHGLITLKKNVYFNLRYRMPGWIRPIRWEEYVPLYQRSKIGFNLHNRGKFTVGNYRLFELPANGVMQISDGGEYLKCFFDPGREIISAEDVDTTIESIEYFLSHENERRDMALHGFRAAVGRHRFTHRVAELADILEKVLPR
jgi:spore maturation protein CgeB